MTELRTSWLLVDRALPELGLPILSDDSPMGSLSKQLLNKASLAVKARALTLEVSCPLAQVPLVTHFLTPGWLQHEAGTLESSCLRSLASYWLPGLHQNPPRCIPVHISHPNPQRHFILLFSSEASFAEPRYKPAVLYKNVHCHSGLGAVSAGASLGTALQKMSTTPIKFLLHPPSSQVPLSSAPRELSSIHGFTRHITSRPPRRRPGSGPGRFPQEHVGGEQR